jgi:hypothetical protein
VRVQTQAEIARGQVIHAHLLIPEPPTPGNRIVSLFRRPTVMCTRTYLALEKAPVTSASAALRYRSALRVCRPGKET